VIYATLTEAEQLQLEAARRDPVVQLFDHSLRLVARVRHALMVAKERRFERVYEATARMLRR
jgi:hypothetical protein